MTNDNNGRLSFEATIDNKDFNKKVDEMGKEVVGLGKTVGESSILLDKSIAQLTTHLGDLKKQLANTRGVEGIRLLNIEIDKTQKEITRLSNIGKKGFDDLGNALPKVSNEAKKTGEEFDKLGKKIKDQPQDVGMLTKAFGGLGSMFKSIAASFGLFAGIQGVVSTIRSAVSDVVAFDKSMTNLSAIAGQSRSSLKGLESDIRKIASESINTATAVADMAMELIKLGTTPQGVRELLKPVNDLSIAFQASADATAVLLKGTLNAFQASESEAQRYADVMAMSANKTALGFQEIADSFSYISATANVAGYSIEETASFMGVLVDNNVQASSAGRVLSSVFGRLAKGGKELEGELEKIRNSQDKLGQASKIFGAEGARLGVILANNKDRLSELNEEFKNSAGSLAKLTNQQLESVSAKWNIAVSAVQELFLTLDSGNGVVSRFFKGFLDGIALVATKLSELGKTEVTGLINTQLDLNRRITEILNVTAQTAEGAKERLNLIKELKREYPDFLAGIDAETISNQTLLGALQEINEEYRQRVILQGQTEGANKLKNAYEEQLQMQEVSKRNLIELLNLFNQKYDLKVDIDFSNIEKSTEQMIKGLKDKGVVKIPFFSDFGQLTSELQQFKSNTANLQVLEQAYNRQKKSVDELRKSNKYLTVEEKEAMKAGQEYYKTLDEFGNVRKKSNEEAVKGLNEENNKTKERLALLDKIDKAERSINESVLSERETAIQKTLEKYRELNKEAVKLGMNTERIQELQSKELEVVSYKADTNELTKNLSEQRKLYDEFEAYKLKVGEEKAKEMYSNLIDVGRNYYELLGSELDKIDVNNMTAKEKDRYNVLMKMLVEFASEQDKLERERLANLYTETISTEQKIFDIRASYAKKYQDLEANYTGKDLEKRKAELDKSLSKELNSLSEDVINKADDYANVANLVANSTRNQIEAQIKSLENFLSTTSTLTEAQRGKIEQMIVNLRNALPSALGESDSSASNQVKREFDNIEKEIYKLEKDIANLTKEAGANIDAFADKISLLEGQIAGLRARQKDLKFEGLSASGKDISTLGNEFTKLGESIVGSDNILGGFLKTIGQIAFKTGSVVSAIGDIGKAFSDIEKQGGLSGIFSAGKADGGGFLGGIGAVAGYVTPIVGGISLITGAIESMLSNTRRNDKIFENMVNRSLLSSKRRQEELEALSKNSIPMDYLTEQLNTLKKQVEPTVRDITSLIDEANFLKMIDKPISDRKPYMEKMLEAYRSFLDTGDYKEFIETMRDFESEGWMTKGGSSWVKRLEELNSEIGVTSEKIEELQQQMKELVTGTSINQLSNAFADMFANGTNNAIQFGDTLESVIRGAIVAGFKANYIDKEMQSLFEELAKYSEDGELTQTEIDKFREDAQQKFDKLNTIWEQLTSNLDVDFGEDVQGTMRDSVKRITEQQADRLVGITMGIQTMLSQNQGTNKKALETLITSQNLLNSSYQTLISIEANTRRSADGIDSINGKLDTIISNNDNSYTKSLGL